MGRRQRELLEPELSSVFYLKDKRSAVSLKQVMTEPIVSWKVPREYGCHKRGLRCRVKRKISAEEPIHSDQRLHGTVERSFCLQNVGLGFRQLFSERNGGDFSAHGLDASNCFLAVSRRNRLIWRSAFRLCVAGWSEPPPGPPKWPDHSVRESHREARLSGWLPFAMLD